MPTETYEDAIKILMHAAHKFDDQYLTDTMLASAKFLKEKKKEILEESKQDKN